MIDFIQLGILLGVWVSALAAVFVPLWLHRQSKKVQLQIEASWCFTVPMKEECVRFEVHNAGHRQAKISSIRLEIEGCRRSGNVMDFHPMGDRPPKVIDGGDTASFFIPFRATNGCSHLLQFVYGMSGERDVEKCIKKLMVVVNAGGCKPFREKVGGQLKSLLMEEHRKRQAATLRRR